MQNAGLLKWKTLSWVPADARPLVKWNNLNIPEGVNIPCIMDPPEDWA